MKKDNPIEFVLIKNMEVKFIFEIDVIIIILLFMM